MSITPKALTTLAALVLRHGTAVSKEELLATVWFDTAVEEANLSQNIYTLRKLLAGDFPEGNAIENIPRFGYRFNPPVSESVPVPASVLDPTPPAHPPQPEVGTQQPASLPEAASASSTIRRKPWVVAAAIVLLVAFLAWQWPVLSNLLVRSANYTLVRFTSNQNEDRVSAVAISPDGKLVAYADADGIVLRSTQDAVMHLLPSPSGKVVHQLSWFPDGLHLLMSGVNGDSGVGEVWKISVLREPPVLYRNDAASATASHAGTSVAFTNSDGSELWVMGANGENSRRIAAADVGSRFSVVLWDARDEGLLVQRRPVSLRSGANGRTFQPDSLVAFQRLRLSDGAITANKADIRMGSACLLDNGNLIYTPVKPDEEKESPVLRQVRVDPQTGALGSARDLFRVAESDPHMYELSCSSTGDRLALIRIQGATSVFVGALSKENTVLTDTRRLSLDSEVAYPHAWTHDSRSVLYEAIRSQGKWQIYSQALDRHDPETIAPMAGVESRPMLTPDGRWVLFDYGQAPSARHQLFRVPAEGGMPVPVPGLPDSAFYRCPARTGSCVLMTRSAADGQVTFFNFDPDHGQGRELFRLPSDLGILLDWDLSADGSRLILDTPRAPTPIHIVALSDGRMEAVDLHLSTAIKTVNWAASGDGFFLATTAPAGNELYVVDANRKASLLRTTSVNTWAVPSPDGRYIAFNDRNLDSNVWLLQKQ